MVEIPDLATCNTCHAQMKATKSGKCIIPNCSGTLSIAQSDGRKTQNSKRRKTKRRKTNKASQDDSSEDDLLVGSSNWCLVHHVVGHSEGACNREGIDTLWRFQPQDIYWDLTPDTTEHTDTVLLQRTPASLQDLMIQFTAIETILHQYQKHTEDRDKIL